MTVLVVIKVKHIKTISTFSNSCVHAGYVQYRPFSVKNVINQVDQRLQIRVCIRWYRGIVRAVTQQMVHDKIV